MLFHIPLLAVGGSEVTLLNLAKGIPRDRFTPIVWCSERDGAVVTRYARRACLSM